jgi:cation transport regulator ChaB
MSNAPSDSTELPVKVVGETPVKVEVELPAKVKKPRSEKQKAVTAKALAVLQERREKKKAEEIKTTNSQEIAKEKVREQKRKDPSVEFVTKKELSQMMSQFEAKIKTPPAAAAPPLKGLQWGYPASAVPPVLPQALAHCPGSLHIVSRSALGKTPPPAIIRHAPSNTPLRHRPPVPIRPRRQFRRRTHPVSVRRGRDAPR